MVFFSWLYLIRERAVDKIEHAACSYNLFLYINIINLDSRKHYFGLGGNPERHNFQTTHCLADKTNLDKIPFWFLPLWPALFCICPNTFKEESKRANPPVSEGFKMWISCSLNSKFKYEVQVQREAQVEKVFWGKESISHLTSFPVLDEP